MINLSSRIIDLRREKREAPCYSHLECRWWSQKGEPRATAIAHGENQNGTRLV